MSSSSKSAGKGGDVVKRGFLTKQGRFVKNWKRRFFVLKEGSLQYYESDKDLVPKGQMSLFGAAVVYVEPPKIDRANCIEISTPARSLFVSASSRESLREWALAVQQAAIVASGGKLVLPGRRLQSKEDVEKNNGTAESAQSAGSATSAAEAAAAAAATYANDYDHDDDEVKQPQAGEGNAATTASASAKKDARNAPAAGSAAATTATTTTTPTATKQAFKQQVDAATAKVEADLDDLDPFEREEKLRELRAEPVSFTAAESKTNLKVIAASFAAQAAAWPADIKERKKVRKAAEKWETDEIKLRKVLKGHEGFVNCVDTRDELVVSGGDDGTVRVWNSRTLKKVAVLEQQHEGKVVSLALQGQLIIAGDDVGRIVAWRVSDFSVAYVKRTSNGARCDALVVSGDAKILVSASGEVMQVWDADSGRCLAELKGEHTDRIVSLAIGGQCVFSGSADRTIKVWDMTSLQVTTTLTGHKNWVFCLYVARQKLLSGSETIKMWDISSAHKGKVKCNATIPAPHEKPSVQCLNASPDEAFLFSGSIDGHINLWELEVKSRSKPKASIENKTQFIFDICSVGPQKAPQGRYRIFTADRDGVVKVFE
eukprot:TRINITY_DN58169_c3_g1_i1.p1 TRINITY_DN58169_c3_g1~~TRINITY_DN58169_c3_g1_i1.p1  ORF type:complete len:600 (-),score=313.85 TRINITY_DN58169_c3_g1_i1:30-1829(-)